MKITDLKVGDRIFYDYDMEKRVDNIVANDMVAMTLIPYLGKCRLYRIKKIDKPNYEVHIEDAENVFVYELKLSLRQVFNKLSFFDIERNTIRFDDAINYIRDYKKEGR